MVLGLLKKPNEVVQCPESYQHKGLCLLYFFKEFNLYPSVLHIEHNDYLRHISNFPDPILKYVALYLHHNYGIAKNYFKKDSDNNNNDACAVLNRWLDQQKNFYTYSGTCIYNRRWWNIHIEPLWERLNDYYVDKKCKRFYSYYYKEEARTSLDNKFRRYEQMPEDNICFKNDNDDDNTIKENCAKLSILFYLGEKYNLLDESTEATNPTNNKYCPSDPAKTEKIFHSSMLKAEKLCFCDSIISTIALPISVTVIGTIFLAFFINEFTPIGSIIGTRSKNKVRLGELFNEEAAYKEYETHRNNNQNTDREKNIIYYQSMNG